MRLSILTALALLPATALALPAGEMNFTNTTSWMVVSSSPEQTRNEKEVDIGDIDKDGDLDVVFAIAGGTFGNRNNKIYLNDNGVMREATADLIPQFLTQQDLSRTPLFRDFDRDGWLDLIVVNDQIAGGEFGTTKYYRNNHPGGVFQDFVRETAPLGGAIGYACGADAADYDNDGDVDLWIGNYPNSSQDKLYFWGTTALVQQASNMIPSDSDYTVDVSSADLNGDGFLDITVSNHFDPSWVYYNNLNGTTPGDFAQPNSTQLITNNVQYHNAMEPADFDGDGRIDLYFANYNGTVDTIMINQGNLSNGQVNWLYQNVGTAASTQQTAKSQVADLNLDGRPDVVVSSMSGRPVILRNVSMPGQVAFVDWTPPVVTDSTTALAAFNAALFDIDQDGMMDVMIGGSAGEHTLRGIETPQYRSRDLGGALPSLTSGPVTILGNAAGGTTASFSASGIASGTDLSAIVRSCGDVRLRVTNNTSTSSDRATFGNEEFVSRAVSGNVTVAVEVLYGCGDVDRDGDFDAADRAVAVACATGANTTDACKAFDANLDGVVNIQDANIIGALTANGARTPRAPYLLEVLGR